MGKFSLLLYLLIITQGCNEDGATQKTTEDMNSQNKFQLEISIPWGNNVEEIQPNLIDYPSFGEMSKEQMRKVYAPQSFKLDIQNGIHILNHFPDKNSYFIHFDRKRALVGKTPIPKSQNNIEDRLIKDFVIDSSLNYYVLETHRLENISFNRIFKMNSKGDVLWEKNGLIIRDELSCDSLKGEFDKLLIDKESRVYLIPASKGNVMAQINAENGEIAEEYDLETSGLYAYTTGLESIQKIVYFPEQKSRGLSLFTPHSREEKYTMGDKELYGLLTYPFGVDDQFNCYVYDNSTHAVVKISFGCEVLHREKIKDLLVRGSDNAIFTNYVNGDSVKIAGYYLAGPRKEWSFSIPADYTKTGFDIKLINVDEKNRFYFYTGDTPGKAGTLLVFTENGEIEKTQFPPPDLLSMESSLGNFAIWQVDSDGNIYFPITDQEGFKIIRLNANNL